MQSYSLINKNNSLPEKPLVYRPYKSLSLTTNYSNLGVGLFALSGFRKLSNGIVDIKGIVKKSTLAITGENITSIPLPISCRPSEDRVHAGWFFDGGSANKTNGVFYNANGHIIYAGDNNVNLAYISIEQTFIPDKATGIFFGDSITAGLGASVTTNRWSTLTAGNQNLNEDNQGISGTVLQNSAPILANNGRNRFNVAVLDNFPDRVYILYGLNDLRYNGASFNVAIFQTQLTEIVQACIDFGINQNNIIIGSPPFMVVSAYTRSDYAPFNAGSTIKHQQYADATKNVARLLRVKWANVYQKMIDNGGNSLIDTDQVHPNNAGHGIIRDAMVEANFV